MNKKILETDAKTEKRKIESINYITNDNNRSWLHLETIPSK